MVDVDAMVAGREMDALVAEKVMGLKPPWPILAFYEPSPPAYSTDIAAAWEVLDKAFDVVPGMESGFPAVLHWRNDWRVAMLDGNCVPMKTTDGGKLIVAIASTAPLAICRAALKVSM